MDNTVKVWQLDAPGVADAVAASHVEPKPAAKKPFPTVSEQFPAFSTTSVHANYVDCARWAGSVVLSKSTANRVAVRTGVREKPRPFFRLCGGPYLGPFGA